MVEALLALCISVQALGLSPYREKKACDYMPQIIKSAQAHNIRPEVVTALIFVESGFKRKVVSNKNACGLTQIIPKYTGKITKKYTCSQLKNPHTSIQAGVKILRWWIDYHKHKDPKIGDRESLKRALCSYNAGFRCRPTKKRRKPIPAGMRYAKKVLSKAKMLESKKNQLISN